MDNECDISVSPWMNCLDAAHRMATLKVSALVLIAEKGHLLGILTERDITRATILSGKHPENVKIQESITPNPITANNKSTPMQALQIMCQHQLRHLPLVDSEGKYCDCVDIVKISRILQKEMHGKNEDRNLLARFLFDALDMESHSKETVASMIPEMNIYACLHVKSSVESAIVHMQKYQLTAINVIGDTNELEGIFTESDIIKRVICAQLNPSETILEDVMTKRPLLFISPTISRKDALSLMLNGRCRHLPVVDNLSGIAIGILDILSLTSKTAESVGIKTIFKNFFRSMNQKMQNRKNRIKGVDPNVMKQPQDLEPSEKECTTESINEDIIKPATFLYFPESTRTAIIMVRAADQLMLVDPEENNMLEDALQENLFLKAVDKYTEALDHLEEDVTQLGINIKVKIYVRRGKALMISGSLEKAEHDLKKAIELAKRCREMFPLNALPPIAMDEARGLLCDVLMEVDKYEQSIELLKEIQCERIKEECISNLTCLSNTLKDSAEKCLQKGDIHDAIVLNTNAIRIQKGLSAILKDFVIDHVIFSNRAACYMQIGDFEHGLQDSQTCTSLCQNYVYGWTNTVECLSHYQKYDDIIQTCQEGLSLHPADPVLMDALIEAESFVTNVAEVECQNQKTNDLAKIQQLAKDMRTTSAS